MTAKKFIFTFGLIVFACFFFTSSGEAKKEKEAEIIKIDSWLVLGPMPVYSPPIAATETKNATLLTYDHIRLEGYRPSEGDKTSWPYRAKLYKWEKYSGDELKIESPEREPQIVYLNTYVNVSEFLKAKLKIRTNAMLQVFLDGKEIGKRTSFDKKIKKDFTSSLVLEPGGHNLVVKLLSATKENKSTAFLASIEADLKKYKSKLSISPSPKHRLGIYEVLNIPAVSSASISPDGELVIVTMRQTDTKGKTEYWIELREPKTGKRVQSYRGFGRISSIRWAPKSGKISFVSRDKDGNADLWVLNIKTGATTRILQKIKRFGYYQWAPNESYILYTVRDKGKKEKDGLKRHKSLRDRRRGYRNKSHIYLVTLPDGTTTRLTSGDINVSARDIHPNSRFVLITKNIEDYSKRPFSRTELYKLDMVTMKTELLLSTPFLRSSKWSPDGKRILITGGPLLFDGLGNVVPKDRKPNDYDTQAYIFDPKTKEAVPISKNFDPSIGRVVWNRYDNTIYMLVTEGSKRAIYRYSPMKNLYEKIKTDLDVINNFDLAEKRNTAIFYGSNVNYPVRLFNIDLASGKFTEILDPSKSVMKNTTVGKIKRWNFTNSSGHKIVGRVYYPPNFNKNKKWPLIVYYYGGTSPVTMDFGGRYPKNWWAANGYVVYVLQPRGATGFGQEFSSYHVNDWGKYALYDIIEGTKAFLKAHPFVNAKRVGCLGASYGGFTTELLVARTDVFAAAISHAGISLLPSYWGAGYWGYEYSAAASADSFPWNRKDIYVDRSPLFNADKINTPLLLLHGSVDTNVPTLESDYLFTALKLLGKEVEYIKISNEDHWVLQYKRRVRWSKTIMAWFDKWLKKNHNYWDHLYPPERAAKPNAE